jgi:hypothetical protein
VNLHYVLGRIVEGNLGKVLNSNSPIDPDASSATESWLRVQMTSSGKRILINTRRLLGGLSSKYIATHFSLPSHYIKYLQTNLTNGTVVLLFILNLHFVFDDYYNYPCV